MSPTPPSSAFPGGSRPGGTGAGGNQLASATPSGFIGRYQALEKIGEGGMGSLYLARDPAIDRLVAIKLLRRGFDTEALRERFAREARAAGRLRHPNIVTIFDVGEHDGDPFIAMEFLAGETLGELIRHGAGLSLSRRLKLLEELCDGLAYAHRAGLVHRDVKPANLMVDAEGVLKILDFGIVRVGDSGMTQAGVLVGTINYMSPEQVLGTGVDHRSDIFAVGLVAYELLSGRQAFVGTMKDGLLRRIPNAEIEPLATVVPGLDAEVVKIVEHALQKEPQERYQELARMRNDLARVRQRIEIEEERAAREAASASAETALIAEEVTAPGVPIEPARSSGFGPIADAERALAEGNFRFALTMAGRAAALNPHDRNPSSIVVRAEAALLDRGRTYDSGPPATPRSGSTGPSPSAAQPPISTAAPGTATSQRANYLAVAVAILALLVAGFAVWSQIGRSDGETNADAGQPRTAGGEAAATRPDASQPASEPPTPPQSPPPADPPPATVERSAGAEPAARDSRESAERGPRPASEGRRDTRGAASPAGGRTQSKTAAPPQPQGSQRQQTQTPDPQRSGSGERSNPGPIPGPPSTQGASPPTILPGAPAPPPVTPAAPPKPAEKPQPKAAEPKPEPPPRDLRAEADAGVRAALARYKAAWEALDIDALAGVQVLSAGERRRLGADMSQHREYEMSIDIQGIQPSEDGRSATAVCRVMYRFLSSVGGRQDHTRTQTFSLEKRGDRWMITTLR
jgi:Protein kinase domain